MNRRAYLLACAALLCSAAAAHADDTTAALAQRLFAMIDSLDVEHHWLAHMHVNWQTGDPDGIPVNPAHKDTHCSAFVAAAAQKAGIYILRPPDHGQVLLANAQYDWLAGPGAAQGWTALPDMYAAQNAANNGMFVVAAYKSHNDDRPGHIVIVRPSTKPRDQLTAEGPDITQAGIENYTITTVKTGFADHRRAFAENEIMYYAHAVDPAVVAAAQ